MFKLSSTLANYARREQYFISNFMFKLLYSISVIVRVLELAFIMGFVYLIAVIILSL